MANPVTARTSPLPSITLLITKRDGERFLEASHAVGAALVLAEHDKSEPLHVRLFDACKKCKHPLVVQFLERISRLTATEQNATALIFHDSDKSTKLRELFGILATSKNSQDNPDGPTLSRSDVTSLFRSILMSITACLQCYDSPASSSSSVIVEGQPPISDRPLKKTKLNHAGATTITKDESTDDLGGEGHLQPSQSNSWDSSLATSREEDDTTMISGMRKEVEDIAHYASNDVFKYAQAKSGHGSGSVSAVDFMTFGNWYNDNGGSIVPWIELLRLAKWKAPRTKSCSESNKENAAEKTKPVAGDESSPDISTIPDDGNRTLVSFDFNGSGSPESLVVNISEDNILALTTLASRTGLMQRPAIDVCCILARYASFRSVSGQEMMILRRADFHRALQSLVPEYVVREERESFMESFFDLFGIFEDTRPFLHQGEVDLKEFAVGFCFLCLGNKSAKLAAGFEFLDAKNRGYLTEDQLLRYLQSYLTMLVGMSLLVPAQKRHERIVVSPEKKRAIRQALEHGAKWTLSHFLKASGQTKNEYTFEVFATWYSTGGFNIAPWLELLDLTKVMSLTSATESLSSDHDRKYRTAERRIRPRDRVSSLRRHHQGRGGPVATEILFTFPLGSRRSLVVLKEDALYVSGVVEQLGLWNLKPDDLWIALSAAVDRRRNLRQRPDVAVFVSMKVFTESMLEICPKPNRKRAVPGSSISTNLSMEELISNFFQCFDIEQSDRVALDELMGGLTLLCGGKKSQKLAFAFSIFDTRPGMHGPSTKKRGMNHSLSGEDLFLFLRSILIVTFSTCRQSLDLSDEIVGRYIADAANMICNDVMRHQWETKRIDRVDFDEFGQWYNDGGFERAPWLELLDLLKWVVVDDKLSSDSSSVVGQIARVKSLPLPPPDDSLDNSFFDTDAIMPIDSVRMELILHESWH
jgi:Ca2+-binding EF-hand superfamily protein